MAIVEKVWTPVYGKPCWNVKQGYGSFLTLEFGNPHLEIREPQTTIGQVSARVRRLYERRLVIVHGDWHLWIYCCQWKLWNKTKLRCNSESSSRSIRNALRDLNGQALTYVSVNPKNGASEFGFDLGGRLETSRFDRQSEQWMLYEPSGRVLSIRADGKYLHKLSNVSDRKSDWRKLE